jgi:NAD(P)-dependent dehydrogenase (short-subunit alcohol dehydrogenase family)
VLLPDRSAVITGAGSGVGRATALRLAREGARVVCADLREDWAKQTARLVEQAGGRALPLRCDVCSEDDVAAAVAAAVASFGRLDVMFNNAGIAGFRAGRVFEECTGADFGRLIDVNLRGVFHGCKHAVAQLKRQGAGGAIVNTGSIAGMVGMGVGGSVLYAATKGAVNQLTRALAIECAPFDIRVNAICPSGMPTNFMAASSEEAFRPRPAAELEGIAAMHPLGRAISPEDCAAAVAFLASDQARNITGILFPIDGGFTAR